MILCDREVDRAIELGMIIISPRPGAAAYSATSLDLTLGDTLDRWEFPEPDKGLGQTDHRFCPGAEGFKFSKVEKDHTRQVRIPSEGYPLPPSFWSDRTSGPAHFILGWTREKIYIPEISRLCARVEGKSSLGRMGLGVHVTAPTIHAGFGFNVNDENEHGSELRLEIWNIGPLPIVLVPGMRICQLIIEEVREVPNAGYSGDFNRQGPKVMKTAKQPPKSGRRKP